MSCCAEKTGLASLAEHPGIILFAYLCALLPLGAIYALDFINRDWKTIRETRRGGKIYLIFSLLPLAVVVFYIHLQRVAQDYKEMATAITVAILCILHVLRTIWGLIQLHAFKQWNTHALLVLTRIGFKVPKHIQRNDEKRASKVVGTRISNYWSMVLNCIRKVFKLQKVHKFAQRVLPVSFRNNRDERRTEVIRLVDNYMTVNSSLVDNEFFGAELPCGLNYSLLRNPFRKKISPVSNVLTSGKAEEGVVRWTAAFLACFGTQWLIHTRKLAFFDTRSRADEDENLGGKDLPGRLLCFISFCITHSVYMNFGEGGPYSQEVSILSPLHVMCSSLFEPWVSTLKVTEKNALPHQLRGKSKIRSIELGEYAISLQNFISKWPKDSLHEMEEQEKHAVLNISPHQIAWLNKLMEERDSHVLRLETEFRSHWEGEKLKTLLWQVGYHVDQYRVDIDKWRETMEVFPGVFPTIRESFLELQASIHVDNWVALETGYFPLTYGDVQDEVSEVEESQWGQMFGAQKKLELRRLQLELATKPRTQIYSQVKFLGYVMNFVRRSLSCGRFIDATRGKWNPQICNERTDIFCSDQLIEALQEANSENTNEADGEGNKLDRKSLQMRVLWEIQGALMKKDRFLPSDSSLMMLCMLGYPSLRISKPTDCQDEHIAPSPRNEDVAIPVDPDSESSRTQEVAPQPMRKAHSTKNCRNLKYACVRIDIVEAPQPLHIFFRLKYLSNVAEIWIRSNEDQEVTRFCWQSWKDGFMGRLCAQSEWRSTRMHSRNEILRKEAIVSQFTEEPESGWKWGGWPPFLDEVHSDPKMDRMSEVRIEESVASEELLVVVQENSSGTSCQCGCKEHQLFLSAKEMSDKGQEKQAFELFRTCIIDHMHYPSLRHCVYNAIKQFRKNEEHMGELLEIMYARIGRARTGGTENLCRKFRQYDLEDLVALFGAVYDNCHIQDALFCKSQAALLRSLDGDAGIDRCIENLESLVLKDPSAYYSRNVLAQCFFRKYCSTGHRMDEVLGMKYFMRFDSVYMKAAVDRAFVIEKGSLSRREYARLNALPREVSTLLPISGRFIGEHKIAEYIFLWSSNPAHRISKNAKTAFAIYSRVILEKNNRYVSAMYKKMAANRLAMMYHRGVDGVDKEHTKAETLYEEAIGDDKRFSQINMLQHGDVQSINAMCNLAVMHSQRNDNQQSAEKSVKLFKESIRYVEEKRWEIGPMGRHSTSMNNLAVFMESGKLVQKDIQYAKELYRRAYEINENPIAIYNLAVLLKWEDPSPQNLEEAEKLFSTVADLGADLQSMPVVASQLEKAQGLAATEISRVLPVELEEIDDCLAYVKMVHSSPESFYL